jgi:putative flippase GtrA
MLQGEEPQVRQLRHGKAGAIDPEDATRFLEVVCLYVGHGPILPCARSAAGTKDKKTPDLCRRLHRLMGLDRLLEHVLGAVGLRSPMFLKLARYSSASVVAVSVYAVLLFVGHNAIGWSEMTSHLIAVCLSSIPNYLINRYWTWEQEGKNRLWGEVVPFWVMAILGFILSVIFVAYVEDRSDSSWAVLGANLSAFGVLWVAKFLVLDKLMWRVVHDLHPELEMAERQW